MIKSIHTIGSLPDVLSVHNFKQVFGTIKEEMACPVLGSNGEIAGPVVTSRNGS